LSADKKAYPISSGGSHFQPDFTKENFLTKSKFHFPQIDLVGVKESINPI